MKKMINLFVFCLFVLWVGSQVYARDLSGGVKADSLSELVSKKEIVVNLKGWPEEWSSKKEIPLKTNFPNAKLVLVTEPLGGGDYNQISFIKIDDIYYEFTEENLQNLFAPIESKKEALDYYLFVTRDLGGAWAQSLVYIFKETDYNEPDILYNGGRNAKQKLNNRITTVKKVDKGFLINLIGFNYIGREEFFESEIKVNVNGRIEQISRKVLLDLGPGAVF